MPCHLDWIVAVLRGLFVTGTDTSVGKTVISAALMCRYRASNPNLRYWKPVQTGIDSGSDTADVQRLSRGDSSAVLDNGIRLPRPVSPHLAARLHGAHVDVEWLTGLVATQPGAAWIVEGAGGVLVPLNDKDLMVDLMAALGLPAVVVARSTLGTINHTLLTLAALRSREMRVAGVVMVGLPDYENRRAIEDYGHVRVLGELPPLDPLSFGTLGAWAKTHLDQDGVLAEFLA
jgi:dethiobiotin synthase